MTMKSSFMNIEFQAINWDSIDTTEHKGETGHPFGKFCNSKVSEYG